MPNKELAGRSLSKVDLQSRVFELEYARSYGVTKHLEGMPKQSRPVPLEPGQLVIRDLKEDNQEVAIAPEAKRRRLQREQELA